MVLIICLRYGSGQTKSVDGWTHGRLQNYFPPTSSGDNNNRTTALELWTAA